MSSRSPTLCPEENVLLLKPHHSSLLDRLMLFLREEDVKFKHLAMAAIANLKTG